MLGYFPDPYPGELMYSVCARYADRTRPPDSRRILEALFNDASFIPTVDLQNNLDALINSLPPGSRYCADDLIDNHTLFPVYGPFLRPKNYAEVRKNMRESKFRTTHLKSGMAAGGVRNPKWMRICPICVKEQKREVGEAYWKRLHQVSGVEVCPEHEVFLEDTDVERQSRRSRHKFSSAQNARFTEQIRPLNKNIREHQVLLQLAKDFRWLTDQRMEPDLQRIHHGYQFLLAQQDLANPLGTIRIGRLLQQFRSRFSEAVLRLLQSNLPKNGDSSWIGRLVRNPRGIQSPLRHLLMMQFLNVSAFEFFNLKPESPQSVGSKVPCPNPVCKSYNRNTTELLSQRYNPNIKELTNRFICKECKQIFDAVATDPTRKIVVLERGEIWNNVLISGWSDTTVGSCSLAKKLGVASLTARRHALKLGLKFPRTVKGRAVHAPEASKPRKSKQIYNESDKIHWTKLVQENPELSRSEIRRLEPALFARLYRNNRSWLATQSPKRLPRHKTTNRVDWEQRDQETTERITTAFNKLRRSSPNHPRVTIKELARLSDTERYLSKHLEKLPKTQLVLKQLVESIEDFAIRRINFVLEQFKACDERPTRSHFLYKAGLGSKVKKSPQVLAAIEQAFTELCA